MLIRKILLGICITSFQFSNAQSKDIFSCNDDYLKKFEFDTIIRRGSELRKINPFDYKLIYKVDTTKMLEYNLHFKSDLCVSNQIISRKVFLENSLSSESSLNSDFIRSVFDGRATFIGCNFPMKTLFYRAKFRDGADFRNSKFQNNIDFSYSIFLESITSFDNAIFEHNAFFYGCTFENRTNFVDIPFKGVTDFSSTKSQIINFSNSVFEDNLIFNNSYFEKFLDLSKCTFKKDLLLKGVNLPERLDFTEVKFDFNKISDSGLKVDFRECKLDSLKKRHKNSTVKCNILLHGTDLTKVLLPHSYFEISFDTSTNYEEKISMYETIIKTCKDAGMVESAQGWDIEYRKIQFLHDNSYYWGNFLIFLNEYWWNFGYDKWKILFRWLPLCFLLFWSINYILIDSMYNMVYKDEELGKNFANIGPNFVKWKKGIFIDWKKRLSFTFFYTAVIYFGFKLSHDAVNYSNPKGLLYLYLIYGIGAIHMAYGLSYILNIY